MIVLDSSGNQDPVALANAIKAKNPDIVILPREVDEKKRYEMVAASKGCCVLINRRDHLGTTTFYL